MAENIRLEGPLSGYGFFTVQFDTITALVSVTLTYVIILFQFEN